RAGRRPAIRRWGRAEQETGRAGSGARGVGDAPPGRGRRAAPRGALVPELPEVETVRRDLEKEVVGRRIRSVEVTGTRSIRRHGTKKRFIDRLVGQRIEGIGRRGKYLLLSLGDDLLVVHLGMS